MFTDVLDGLDETALDTLPFGAVALDARGAIVRYNQIEARRAGLVRWQVIGRDFLREVAWTLGPAAAIRVQTFLQGGGATSFRARTTTRSGRHELEVTLRRRPGGGAWLIVEPVASDHRATTSPKVIAS